MILTPDRRLRVFISSTLDMTDERAAARRATERLGLTPVMFEAGARAHPPRALYSAYVQQSDVFVGIYSRRYGWTAPGMDVSGLEDEFDLSTGMSRLVYLHTDVEREPQLAAFLDRVRDAGLSYTSFASPEQLESLLGSDLVVLLTERFHAAEDATGATRRSQPAALPVPATPLLGRTSDIAELASWLRRDEVRLVTLVGPGGIGKTRLAVEAARQLAPDFARRAFFVPLADLREPRLVADTIAAALDVARSDVSGGLPALAEALGQQPTLLVLDNYEQVLAGAETVAALLAASPQLKVLVTSRAPLRVRGEHEFAVASLAVPPETVPDELLTSYAAVQLFVESARAVRPSFDVDRRSAAVVAAICRELDGVPLAIELAAAMVRLLTPDMLLERLRAGLPDLGGGLRDVPTRHRKLSDTIRWSYDLLDGPAREVFAQLSAFRGGFTLEAAHEVCDGGADVFGAVGTLVEHNLLQADVQAEQGPRFSMLGMVQQFASTRLETSAHRDAVLARHADLFTRLAEAVGRPGGREPSTVDRVEVELDNVRRAFEWHLAGGRPDRVANAVWESWWFWWMRGHLHEGTLWTDRCLAMPDLSSGVRARAEAARAMFALWSGDYEHVVPAFVEAARVARTTGDRAILGYADVAVGLIHAFLGSMTEARATIRRGIATFEQIGDELGAATGLTALSWAQGITRQFDDTDDVLCSALQRARAVGSHVETGIAEAALAQYRMTRGNTSGVNPLIGASLEHLAGARHMAATILTLEVIAELGMHAGVPRMPETILAATGAIRTALGTQVPPQAGARLAGLLQQGRQRLEDDFDDVMRRGGALSFSEAVEHGRTLLAQLANGSA